MKKLACATALVTIIACGSVFAGGPAAEPMTAAPEAFEGFYLGANLGGASWDTTWVDRDAWVDKFTTDWALGTVTNRLDVLNAGGQLGYNWRHESTLLGLELNGSWADTYSHVKTYTPSATNVTVLTLRNKLNAFGSLGFRGGIVPTNDLLFYFTTGPALADVHHRWRITDTSIATETFTRDDIIWGGMGGVGLEWAITSNVSLKAEELYYRFTEDRSAFTSPATTSRTVHFDTQDAFWLGRIGFNYNFNA